MFQVSVGEQDKVDILDGSEGGYVGWLVCVNVCMYVCGCGERESGCACVCVCVERESECVRVRRERLLRNYLFNTSM